MRKWKIVTDPSELGIGIYQEKMVVIVDTSEQEKELRQMVIDKKGEFAELPENFPSHKHPYAIAVWINKHITKASLAEVRRGDFRKLVSQ